MRISYKQFSDEVGGKLLALLRAGFIQTPEAKEQAEALAASWDTSAETFAQDKPINIGRVTVRAKDFYRTRTDTGERSYVSRQAGLYAYKAMSSTKKEIYLLLSPDNILVYRLEE